MVDRLLIRTLHFPSKATCYKHSGHPSPAHKVPEAASKGKGVNMVEDTTPGRTTHGRHKQGRREGEGGDRRDPARGNSVFQGAGQAGADAEVVVVCCWEEEDLWHHGWSPKDFLCVGCWRDLLWQRRCLRGKSTHTNHILSV